MSKKASWYKKREKLREKRRKPICVITLPRTLSNESIAIWISEMKGSVVNKDYYLLFVAGDMFEVEVHGSSKLTSFDIQELSKFIEDKIANNV